MPASRTAQYVALYRALETSEPRRSPLFRDPFARGFLSPGLRLALGVARVPFARAAIERYADWRAPGARSSAIGRTRFIDDVVRGETARGVGQIVLLGAGYDTRAHRMPELLSARVFEVDRAGTQEVKRRLVEASPAARRDVTYVAVDFGVDDLATTLAASGWAQDRETAFVWEGVTNYLDEEDVARVMGLIGRCAPGSAVVFTYIHRGVLDGSTRFEGADRLVRAVRELGEPWRFGLLPAEVGAFLARFGLVLEADLGADEYRARYLGGGARDLVGYAFYRVAVARVAG